MSALSNANFVAGGTIAPCRLVSMIATGSTAADFTVFQATVGAGTEGDEVIGVSQEGTDLWSSANAATVGEQVRIFGPGEICMVECGGTVTAGAAVKATTGGKIIVCAADQDRAAGWALQSGTSGVKVQMLIHPFHYMLI